MLLPRELKFALHEMEVLPVTPQPQHMLKRVKLQLARSKEFPSGSTRHGYDIVAPLDAQGRIDLELWRQHRDACRVRRFWDDEEDAITQISAWRIRLDLWP